MWFGFFRVELQVPRAWQQLWVQWGLMQSSGAVLQSRALPAACP